MIRTESEEEKGFFEALNKLGIETKVKDIRIFAGGAKKADWDLGTVIDVVAMAQKLDTIILATGDGDFVPLVEYLKYAQGCQVEVISFGKSSRRSAARSGRRIHRHVRRSAQLISSATAVAGAGSPRVSSELRRAAMLRQMRTSSVDTTEAPLRPESDGRG